MACGSDHMEQTNKEAEYQRAAKLLVYVYENIGVPVKKTLLKTASECYASVDYTAELCGVLLKQEQRMLDAMMYTPRTGMARALAEWWEAHQAADNTRKHKEDLERKRQALAIKAKKKLSKAERDALGIK